MLNIAMLLLEMCYIFQISTPKSSCLWRRGTSFQSTRVKDSLANLIIQGGRYARKVIVLGLQSGIHEGKRGLGFGLELMWSGPALCGCVWPVFEPVHCLTDNATVVERKLTSSLLLFPTTRAWCLLGEEQPVFKWRWCWRPLLLDLPSVPCGFAWSGVSACNDVLCFQMENC